MTKKKLKRITNLKRHKDGIIIPMRKCVGKIKNRYKVRKLFLQWLSKNDYRFNHPPLCKGGIKNEFYYEHIIPNIQFHMNYNRIEATLFFYPMTSSKPEECWDIYDIQYIGNENYDKDMGYYDADSIDKKFKFYTSQDELYINEVFEYIIEYTNKIFVPDNRLYLYRSQGGGWTKAQIESADKTKIFNTLIELDSPIISQEGNSDIKMGL